MGYVVFFVPALFFTVKINAFDKEIGRRGLREASAKFLKTFYRGVTVSGAAIPQTGGVLLLSNHPGLGDSLAALSLIPRTDLKIIAWDKEFFQCLPNLYAHILPVQESRHSHGRAAYQMLSHLRSGKSLLIYPAGKIEPDPALCEGDAFLGEWKEIAPFLVVKARKESFDFAILPLLVSNVFNPRAFHLPFLSKLKSAETRETLAAFANMLFRMSRRQNAKVWIGGPLDSLRLADSQSDAARIHQQIIAEYQKRF